MKHRRLLRLATAFAVAATLAACSEPMVSNSQLERTDKLQPVDDTTPQP